MAKLRKSKLLSFNVMLKMNKLIHKPQSLIGCCFINTPLPIGNP